MQKKLQVWWMPQVPMKEHFTVEVATVEEGVKVMNILADYDLFLRDNKIRPDYSNAGGLNQWDEDNGDGVPGWVDWHDEETGEDDPREFLSAKDGEKNEQ